jgi:superfamily II DNA or RNA helicase
VELRAWQRDALELWSEQRRGIVAVVTGGGKTVFALAAAKLTLSERPALRVMVLVPTVALQDQWLEEIDQYFPGRSVSDSADSDATFVVLVINSARRIVPVLDNPAQWMQIVDECHRAATTENRLALMGDAWAVVGLSATPERQYDDLTETVLEPVLGPVIFRYSYAEALRDGVISEFELNNYHVPMTSEEVAAIDSISQRIARQRADGDAASDQIKALLMRRARLIQSVHSREPVAVALIREKLGDRSGIVFHESTYSAERIASQLRFTGIPTSVYHSRMDPSARRRDLHLFRLGATSVMVCCRALDEGLNVPRAKFAVIAASTATTRQRIQRLGRMLRPDASGGRAQIASLYATEGEARRLLAESESLDGLVTVRWFSSNLGGTSVVRD